MPPFAGVTSKSPNVQGPILILGCRRSGTTLLRELLSQHPDLLVHPQEPQFLLGLYQRHGNRIRNLTRAVRYICEHPYCPPAVSQSALIKRVRSDGINLTRELVYAYLLEWGGTDIIARRPVLKDPVFIFSLDLLGHWFPQVRVIHIYRDPRGNVASQRARWPGASVTECAVRWREAVSAAGTWKAQNPTRCFHLPYEWLVREPEDALKSLCGFLGIPFIPEMVAIDLEEKQVLRDESTLTERQTHIDPSRIDSWKLNLTPNEVYLIERIVRIEMTVFGYSRAGPDGFNPWRRVRGLLEGVKFTVLRIGRRVKHGFRLLAWRVGWRK